MAEPTDKNESGGPTEKEVEIIDVKIDAESIPKINVDDEPDFKEGFPAAFDQKASFEIARWTLGIFGGVILLNFIVVFCMLRMEDATFDGLVELIKFMMSAIVPLVTLAVGYYLGDRGSNSSSSQ